MDPETPDRIEPCTLDRPGEPLVNLLAELPAAAMTLGLRLPAKTAQSLAELVRVMNCYYSNLIEGHNTRPREIERALNDQFEVEGERRNLQLEARAHIRVQREVDQAFAGGQLGEPATSGFVRRLHASFYRDAPEDWLTIHAGPRALRMVPGEFRSRPDEDVDVGRHRPPSGPLVAGFIAHFERRFRLAPLGLGKRLIAIAAAHHRFNFIHPFLDGNGRVSRLMSHAMALQAGIGAHGLWSISRGLARGLADAGEYKQMMDLADSPRRGDLDGRGNLSLEALEEFVTWFLAVALDQVRFMTTMFDLPRLQERLVELARVRALPAGAGALLAEVAVRGELPRGDAGRVVGLKERAGRDVLRALTDAGLLASDTPKGAVSLRFTVDSADTLFPNLFLAAQG